MEYRRLLNDKALLDKLKGMDQRLKNVETQGTSTMSFVNEDTGVETRIGVLPDGNIGVDQWINDTTPPPVATAPIVAAIAGQFAITWDGSFAASAPMPRDFSRVEITGFNVTGGAVTGSGTVVGSITDPETIVYVSTDIAAAGDTWRFYFSSVDYNGNKSDLSNPSDDVMMQAAGTDPAVYERIDQVEQDAQDAKNNAQAAQNAANDAQKAVDSLGANALNLALGPNFDQTRTDEKLFIDWVSPNGSVYPYPDSSADIPWAIGGRVAITLGTGYTYNNPMAIFSKKPIMTVTNKIYRASIKITSIGNVSSHNMRFGLFINNTSSSGSYPDQSILLPPASTMASGVNISFDIPITAVSGYQAYFGIFGAFNGDENSGIILESPNLFDATALIQAQNRADQAYNQAVAAATAAGTAQTTADGKNRAWYQNTAPPTAGNKVNDVWYDTGNGNRVNIWNGTAWTSIQDTGIVAAQNTANAAQTAANGKNTNYYQATQPSGGTYRVGDTWFDTANGYRISTWTGSAWQLTQDSAGALSVANGKNKTFIQGTAPTASAAGDLWIDTANSNQLKRWSGSAWVDARDTTIAAAQSAANAAQTTANGKNTNYYQNSAPSGGTYKVGDVWFDTANNYRMSSWTGSAWQLVQDSAAASATAATKTKTYFQGTSPSNTGNTTGDIWFDTSNGNKVYVWNGSAWTNAQDAGIAAAQSSANGKNTVFYQGTAPATTGRVVGDTWFNTSDGNKVSVWNGSAWTLSPFGTNAIANLAITNAQIADATIQAAKIGSIDAGTITAGTLSAARIAAGTITGTHIAGNTITASNMVAGTITAASGIIADAAITTAKIADLAVNNAKIAALDAGKITTGFLDANRIQANTITGTHIAANTITAGNMVAGTITAASGIIADAAITNAKIANVDAGKITTGFLDANRIDARTITVDKLLVGSFDNLISDPNFLKGNLSWAFTAQTTALPTGGVNNSPAIRITGNGTAISVYNNPQDVPLNGVASFKLLATVKSATALPAGAVVLTARWKNAAGTTTYSTVTNPATLVVNTWTTFSGIVTPPSDAISVSYAVGVASSVASGQSVDFNLASSTRASDGSLIVDGSIKGNHVQAGSLDAGVLTAGSITSTQIGAKSITADRLILGDTNNLCLDPNLATPNFWTTTANTSFVTSSTSGVPSGAPAATLMKMNSVNAANDALYNNGLVNNSFVVAPGEAYAISYWIARDSTTNSNFRAGLDCTDVTGATHNIQLTDPSTPANVPAGTWVRMTGTVTIPSGFVNARLMFGPATQASPAGAWYVTGVFLRRAATGELIVDGAIDGRTITGATIRTAASGARITLDSTGLNAYTSTAQYFSVNPTTGVQLSGIANSFTTFKNYCTNPSVENNLNGWSINSGFTLARSTAQAKVGTYSILAARSSTGADMTVTRQKETIPSGVGRLIIQTAMLSNVAGFNVKVNVTTYNSSNAVVAVYAPSNMIIPSANSWVNFSIAIAVDSTATSIGVSYTDDNNGIVANWYLDACMITEESHDYTYFDGNTSPTTGNTYAWDGTAGNSTSSNVRDTSLVVSLANSALKFNGKNLPGVSFDQRGHDSWALSPGIGSDGVSTYVSAADSFASVRSAMLGLGQGTSMLVAGTSRIWGWDQVDLLTSSDGVITFSGKVGVEATPTFQNGWTDFGSGYTPTKVIKISMNLGYIDVMMKPGTVTNGTVIGVLPAGFRPVATSNIVASVVTTTPAYNLSCLIQLNTNGNIVVFGLPASGTSYINLHTMFRIG